MYQVKSTVWQILWSSSLNHSSILCHCNFAKSNHLIGWVLQHHNHFLRRNWWLWVLKKIADQMTQHCIWQRIIFRPVHSLSEVFMVNAFRLEKYQCWGSFSICCTTCTSSHYHSPLGLRWTAINFSLTLGLSVFLHTSPIGSNTAVSTVWPQSKNWWRTQGTMRKWRTSYHRQSMLYRLTEDASAQRLWQLVPEKRR